jgi:hypothetical protein
VGAEVVLFRHEDCGSLAVLQKRLEIFVQAASALVWRDELEQTQGDRTR